MNCEMSMKRELREHENVFRTAEDRVYSQAEKFCERYRKPLDLESVWEEPFLLV